MCLEPEPKWKKIIFSTFYYIKILAKIFEKNFLVNKGEKRGDFFDAIL